MIPKAGLPKQEISGIHGVFYNRKLNIILVFCRTVSWGVQGATFSHFLEPIYIQQYSVFPWVSDTHCVFYRCFFFSLSDFRLKKTLEYSGICLSLLKTVSYFLYIFKQEKKVRFCDRIYHIVDIFCITVVKTVFTDQFISLSFLHGIVGLAINQSLMSLLV